MKELWRQTSLEVPEVNKQFTERKKVLKMQKMQISKFQGLICTHILGNLHILHFQNIFFLQIVCLRDFKFNLPGLYVSVAVSECSDSF